MGSFNRYITHLGGGGIDFCYGALWKLRYGALQGGRGGLKSSKTGVT